MKKQDTPVFFNQEHASSYDQKREKLGAMKDALHLCIRSVLSELPTSARILCVGVGTGAELIDLAQAFPQWEFTAVEPAAPMLDICRKRAEESGIASRCTFHEDYLDTLVDTNQFDAATSILVSQFIMEPEERCAFFRSIAARLLPGGYLISADLASDMSTAAYESLAEVWWRTMKAADLPGNRDSFGRGIAVIPPEGVASIIATAGFRVPVLFFQTLLIHAWYARLDS